MKKRVTYKFLRESGLDIYYIAFSIWANWTECWLIWKEEKKSDEKYFV